MKIMKKSKILNRDANKFSKAIIISLFLVTSIFVAGTSVNADVESLPPKTIWGYVTYCNGGPAVGASVVVSASGYPDETDTTDSGGAYSVDIGPDSGTEWPDSTPFTVTATLGSWSGSNSGTVSGSVTQVDVTLDPPALVASAGASPTTIVAGESVDFTGSASGGATPYSWSWDFDGGASGSTQQNPTNIVFNTQGTYNCVLTVTDDCSQTDTDNVVITVNPALGADAGGPYSGDICNCVQLDGTATGGHGGNTYSWDFDVSDGIQVDSTLEDPCALYDSDDTYTATLTVTDSNMDTATDTATVTISTAPVVADAGGPYSGTVCSPISFSGGASGGCTPYTYSWTFGDGDTGSGQNPSHQYDTDDTYTVTVTVTDSKGSSDTDTAPVTISTPALVADAHGPYNGFSGISLQFAGSASGGCSPYSFSWNFGDGGSSNQQNPSYTYDDPGEYTVTLTVTDDKSDTAVDTTTASILPSDLDVDANGPYYGEVGVPIDFSGSVDGGVPPYSYQWSFGDGGISQLQNPSHVYDEPSPSGGFVVTLSVSDSQGTSGGDQTRAHIDPSEDPVANAGGPYEGDVDEMIDFTGSASGGSEPYSFSWDLDDDGEYDDASGSSAQWSWDTAGVYTVSLKVVDDNNEEDTDDATVTVNEPTTNSPPDKPSLPKYTGLGRNPIVGLMVDLCTSTTDPDDDQVFYWWDFGDGSDSGWLGPHDSGEEHCTTHDFTQGTYTVKVKAKDTQGAESEWSDPISITIPKSRGINLFFFSFLQQHPILYQILLRILKL